MSSLCHLHNHSHFSLMDGAQNIQEMVTRAKTLGMTALALTDHGNLHGSLKFYRICREQGINPIIGYEAYVTPGQRADRKPGVESTHLTILAKNNEGYRNLVRLASVASLEGFYHRPRIDREAIETYSHGLIVLSGCINSELSRACLNGDEQISRSIAEYYRKLFGDDFYLEIMNNGTEYQRRCTSAIIDLSRVMGLPLVATADCHYTNPEDHDLQDVMVCISTGRVRVMPKEAPRLEETVYYMRTPEQMAMLFEQVPDAVSRTQQIADQVHVEIETGVRHFPKFAVPKTPGVNLAPTSGICLRKLCYDGMRERLGLTSPEYTGRLERELEVIHNLGFDEYFLVVWDFCEFARSRGILAAARGSGVGSLVSYCLGISHVDPIEYGLLFERFLDPSRREAPDIDIDFDKERRSEVIEYVRQKYGADCVAQIGTFGTLGAKMALKDVGRVECIPQSKSHRMAELVPELPGITLADCFEKAGEFKQMVEEDASCKKLFDMAVRIEGMAKSIGTHAAGVVIADQPLVNYVPLMKGKDGSTITQWDMDDCEKVGLLKMDFLGLRNLTILHHAIRIIEDRTGKRIDIHRIPMNNSAVFDMLARGETKGVFQLEATGMTGLLIRMKPTCLENIIACIALYRPGPLDAGMVDEYLAVKNGEKKATYAHPAMEKILGYTHGVMVYQEQVMMVLNQVGGIPLSESYSCIKAISKKIKGKVEKYHPLFVAGCAKNGVDGELLWEQIGTFARYGFNKSHSTAYAFIGYQTAYLKHYYPVEFMAALLSCDIAQRNFTGRDPLIEHLEDCRFRNIEVVMPNVNTCGSDFRVRNDKIFFGLDAIKGVPHSASVAITAAQPFIDLFDFCKRVPKAVCPRAAIRNLIQVGAMAGGSLHSRPVMEATIDRAMKLAAGEYKRPEPQQGKWSPAPAENWRDTLELERQLTGLYITDHPTSQYPWMKFFGDVRDLQAEGMALLGGVITTIEERQTHGGKRFVTFVLDSGPFSTECIMWDPQSQIFRILKDGSVVVIRGRANRRGSNNTLTVNSIRSPEDYLKTHQLGVAVEVVESSAVNATWIASRYPGDDPFTLRMEGHAFVSDLKVRLGEALLGDLAEAGYQAYITERKL